MTTRENQLLFRGVAAGVVIGLATGLLLALAVFARRPELCLDFVRF